MDKLESDLESFVRICHLHEKVDMLEHALAEKDREIAELKEWKSIILGTGTDQEAVIRMAAAGYTQVAVQAWKQSYHALMKQAMRLSEYAALLSNAVLRVGEFENETDSWPVYHHAGGINNECSGVVAEFPTERLARAFVDYHTVANEFLASPEVQAWRKREEGKK